MDTTTGRSRVCAAAVAALGLGLPLLLAAGPSWGCAVPSGPSAAASDAPAPRSVASASHAAERETPEWVLTPPNEPGLRLYAVALDSGGTSTRNMLRQARANLLDKAFALSYRAVRSQRNPRHSFAAIRAALETITASALPVVTDRYDDPRTGQTMIAVMVALDFRTWHTAVFGFPPRRNDPLTQALLEAHMYYGDRPYFGRHSLPDDDAGAVVAGATEPSADGAETPPQLMDPSHAAETASAQPTVAAAPAPEPRPEPEPAETPVAEPAAPGRARLVVVAVPETRDPTLAGWPTAEADARLLAEAWTTQRLAVSSEPAAGRMLEPDPQPVLLAGPAATAERILSALRRAADSAQAVVLVYLGRAHLVDGRVMLVTADSRHDELPGTGLAADTLRDVVAELDVPGLVLVDGAVLPTQAEGRQDLGWPTIWPARPGQRAHADDLRGHGLASYFAVQGLRNGRADRDGDGRISVDEWTVQLAASVASASRHHGVPQRPWLALPGTAAATVDVIPVE